MSRIKIHIGEHITSMDEHLLYDLIHIMKYMEDSNTGQVLIELPNSNRLLKLNIVYSVIESSTNKGE